MCNIGLVTVLSVIKKKRRKEDKYIIMAIPVVLHVSMGALCSYSKLERNLWVLK